MPEKQKHKMYRDPNKTDTKCDLSRWKELRKDRSVSEELDLETELTTVSGCRRIDVNGKILKCVINGISPKSQYISNRLGDKKTNANAMRTQSSVLIYFVYLKT
jgi:hypothetical protein